MVYKRSVTLAHKLWQISIPLWPTDQISIPYPPHCDLLTWYQFHISLLMAYWPDFNAISSSYWSTHKIYVDCFPLDKMLLSKCQRNYVPTNKENFGFLQTLTHTNINIRFHRILVMCTKFIVTVCLILAMLLNVHL